MSKFTLVFLLCLLAVMLGLIGCRSKDKMVLRVGTNSEYPPFSYLSGNQFMGIDVDIVRRIGDKLGMKVEITNMPFEQLFSALSSNKIDIAASALTITEERKQSLDFTDSYYTANQVLVAKIDSPVMINELNDLGKYTIGTLRGTTGHIYIDENLVFKDILPLKQLKLYSTNIEAIGDLLDGKLDLVVIDDSAAWGYSRQKPLRIAYTIPTQEQYGIAMQKDKQINDKVSKAMQELISSGEVKTIIASHFKKP